MGRDVFASQGSGIFFPFFSFILYWTNTYIQLDRLHMCMATNITPDNDERALRQWYVLFSSFFNIK